MLFFFFQAEDGIRDLTVTGVQTLLFRSLQKENNKLTPRGYYSYTFTPTERKWQSMVAKEAMVIRKAIEHFKRDIKMINPNWITIQTDNQALVNMIRKPAQYEGEVQMAKYMTMNYYVEHIKGENNILADALSRELKAKNNPVEKLDRIRAPHF